MMPFTEDDLRVIKRIQELKSCKVAQAAELYRGHARKLADPDHAQRHEIIWDRVQRGEKGSEIQKEEKVTPKKAAPKKKAKKATAELKAARPVVELAELTREVELTPVVDEDSKYVHTAVLFGKKHAVLFASARYEGEEATKARFYPVHVSETRLAEVKRYAAKNDLPVAVCVSVRIKGRLDQGYALQEEVFSKFSNKMSRGRVSVSLSGEARLAYRENGWDGCKFTEAKAESAAAD